MTSRFGIFGVTNRVFKRECSNSPLALCDRYVYEIYTISVLGLNQSFRVRVLQHRVFIYIVKMMKTKKFKRGQYTS